MKKFFIAAASLIIVFSAFLSWVWFTESGFVALVRVCEKIMPGELQIDRAGGKLSEKFYLGNFHYNSETLDLQIQRFELFWNPHALLQGDLHLYSCRIESVRISTTSEEEKSESATFMPPDLILPVKVKVEEFLARDIELVADESTYLGIDRIELELAGGETRLVLSKAHLKGENFEGRLAGNIGMVQGWPVELSGQWHVILEDYPEMHGIIKVYDTLEDGGFEVALQAPYDASLTGRFWLAEGVRWQAGLKAVGVDPGIFSGDLSGKFDLEAETAGEYEEEKFTTELLVNRLEGELLSWPLSATGKARFDGEKVEIAELNLASGNSKVSFKGSIADTYDLEYTLYSLDVTSLVSWLEADVQAKGEVTGRLDNPVVKAALQAERIRGEGVAAASLAADIKGQIVEDARVQAEVRVRDLQYEGQKLDRVLLILDGNLENHTLRLSLGQGDLFAALEGTGGYGENLWQGRVNVVTLTHPDYGRLKLADPVPVKAGVESVDVGRFCLEHESGKLCLGGRLVGQKWQTEAELENFNPQYFLPDWDGTLYVRLSGNGDLGAETLTYSVDMEELSGKLKQKDVQGSGRLEQQGGTLSVSALNLRFDGAFLTANGNLGKEYAVDFNLNIPEVREIFPEVEGAVQSTGTVTGSLQMPVAVFEVSLENGRFGEVSIASITGKGNGELVKDGTFAVQLLARDVAAGTVNLSNLSLMARGNMAKHRFIVDTANDLGTARIEGMAGFASSWQGSLTGARVALDDYGVWNLRRPAAFDVGAEQSRLDPFCLGFDLSGVCVQGSVNQLGEWSVETDIESFSLGLFCDSDRLLIPLEGELAGNIKIEGVEQNLSLLEGWLDLPTLVIGEQLEDDLTYRLSKSRLSASFKDNLIGLTLQSRFQEGGRLAGQVKIGEIGGNFENFKEAPLSGKLDFDIKDLSFISIMTESRLQPSGGLLGSLDIAGSVANPSFGGRMSINEGEVVVADLGIILKEVTARMNSKNNAVDFNITARSGPGTLRSEGAVSFDWNRGLRLTSDFTGKDFEIINSDEYLFRVTPELKLVYGEEKNLITGNLAIPYGRITLNGGSGRIEPSDDVVIVSDRDRGKEKDSSFVSDIILTAGEDVTIDAYGLKSGVGGSLRLLDEKGKNFSATGELVIKDGKFSLYSTELDISRGRLLFTGGSVDDPGVDVRAHRRIEDITVGVDVSGTAQDLEFQLFSEPAMEESNILAYILMGRSLYASTSGDVSLVEAAASALGIRGVNTITNSLGKYVPVDEIYLDGGAGDKNISIVLGKHITQDLFVGYDYDFFSSIGEFRAEYDLWRDFSIETRSSVESTSGEFVYTIKK